MNKLFTNKISNKKVVFKMTIRVYEDVVKHRSPVRNL